MYKSILILLAFFAFSFNGIAQIKVSSSLQSYDSILNGDLIYYQFSWDDPIDELPEVFPLAKPLNAFYTKWDTMIVSDGSLVFVSSKNKNSLLIIDGSGWDLMDKGYSDTINFPNISPVIVSADQNEVEWRGFGFANELDSLDSLQSTGNIIMKVDSNNKVNITYGDFSIVRPDLCFEGFGGLRPSVTYIDENDSITTWYVYGDPKFPAIDTLSDTAFSSLPDIGQSLILDFNKTNFIAKQKISRINVFPNPAAETINIEGFQSSEFDFSIIALNGKVVKKGRSLNKSIDVSDLQNGNFIIKIKNQNSVYYSKFLKL